MGRQKRSQQKKKKTHNRKKSYDERMNSSESEIHYSLINEEHDTNFKKHFYIKSISTDGNCLFRAVSDQLFKNDDNYREIRTQVVEHLLKKEEDYKHFIENDESYESYVDRIRKDGTWGGQIELQAVGEIFNVNILIYQENGCILEIKNHDDNSKCIQLHYAANEHYNSVRFKNKDEDYELKSINYLKEILNYKADDESMKTFYETTENELTDEIESEQCEVTRYTKENSEMKELYPNDSVNINSQIDYEKCENKHIQDAASFESNTNFGKCLGLVNKENRMKWMNMLYMVYRDIRRKNKKKKRSRSLPNVKENFLYFFFKSKTKDQYESDSTIGTIDDENTIDRKNRQKKNKLVLMNFDYRNEQDFNLNEYFEDNDTMSDRSTSSLHNYKESSSQKKMIRVHYNKLFYRCLRLYGEVKKCLRCECVRKASSRTSDSNEKSTEYKESDCCNDPDKNNDLKDFKNIESRGSCGYISNFELENPLPIQSEQESSSTCSNRKKIANEIADLYTKSNKGNKKNARISKKKSDSKKRNSKIVSEKKPQNKMLDIIINELGTHVDISSFLSSIQIKEHCAKPKRSCDSEHVHELKHLDDSLGSNQSVSTQKTLEDIDECNKIYGNQINVNNENNGNMSNDNNNPSNRELTNCMTRQLIVKRNHQHNKMIQIFSKDYFLKGYFNFLNADLVFTESNLKYILEYYCHNKKVNIFKKHFNKHDLAFCSNLMFQYNVPNELFQKGLKCTSKNNREFITNLEEKYKNGTKENKSSKKKKEHISLRIISV